MAGLEQAIALTAVDRPTAADRAMAEFQTGLKRDPGPVRLQIVGRVRHSHCWPDHS
jgi:hypothetical protein